jgi:hypothetical protein
MELTNEKVRCMELEEELVEMKIKDDRRKK